MISKAVSAVVSTTSGVAAGVLFATAAVLAVGTVMTFGVGLYFYNQR